MELPILYEDIIKILPHRYPFLLVDRIIEFEPGKRAVGIKNVSSNESFFQGHFPGNPIMPGVLIVEGMAQVGGILGRLSLPEDSKIKGQDAIFFMSMNKVKFRKQVIPGDQIIYDTRVLRLGSKIWKMAGKAYVDDKLVTEAELVASLG